MTIRTLMLSSIEELIAFQDGSGYDETDAEKRQGWLRRRPYNVMLQASFPEIDFANRWCWHNFGPADGECFSWRSEYRGCDINGEHSHVGRWTFHFFVKSDYDFGFVEWYFADNADRNLFLANLDNFHWGENYPKN